MIRKLIILLFLVTIAIGDIGDMTVVNDLTVGNDVGVTGTCTVATLTDGNFSLTDGISTRTVNRTTTGTTNIDSITSTVNHVTGNVVLNLNTMIATNGNIYGVKNVASSTSGVPYGTYNLFTSLDEAAYGTYNRMTNVGENNEIWGDYTYMDTSEGGTVGQHIIGSLKYLLTYNATDIAEGFVYETQCSSTAGTHYGFVVDANYADPTVTDLYAFWGDATLLTTTGDAYGLFLDGFEKHYIEGAGDWDGSLSVDDVTIDSNSITGEGGKITFESTEVQIQTLFTAGSSITMKGIDQTYNEDLVIDFEGQGANVVGFSSGTGVTELDFAEFNLDIGGDIDVNSTANLDNTDIDGTFACDGATFSVDMTGAVNISSASGQTVLIGNTLGCNTGIGNVDGTVTLGPTNVGGAIVFNYAATFNNDTIIDHTDTEAFLVRQNGDGAGADTFIVDTTNKRVGINKTPTVPLDVTGAIAGSTSITAGTSFIRGTADLNETDLEKLDGITNGTAYANKAVVLDASKNIATIGTIGCGTITVGTAVMSATDLEKLDDITNGTAAANKCLVLGAGLDISGIDEIGCGTITVAANSDITLSGTGHITSGSEGFIVGTLTITDGSIDDSDGAISFGDTNLSTTGSIGNDHAIINTGGYLIGPTAGTGLLGLTLGNNTDAIRTLTFDTLTNDMQFSCAADGSEFTFSDPIDVTGGGTFSGTVEAATLAATGLTANRIPYNTDGKTLIDSAALTFDGTDLATTGAFGCGAITSQGKMIIDVTDTEAFLVRQDADAADVFIIDTTNKSVVINGLIYPSAALAAFKYSSSGSSVRGIHGSGTQTNATASKVGKVADTIYGLSFGANYTPSAELSADGYVNSIIGVVITPTATSQENEDQLITLTEIKGFYPEITLTTGTNATGDITATNAYLYPTVNPILTAGASGGATPTITNLYGFYDPGLTVGGTNWGVYSLTPQSAVCNLYPTADDTYYLGKNDDDSPAAWKGIILKDTANGKYYRIEVTNGSVVATDLTD